MEDAIRATTVNATIQTMWTSISLLRRLQPSRMLLGLLLVIFQLTGDLPIAPSA